jgi:hypothetical protein
MVCMQALVVPPSGLLVAGSAQVAASSCSSKRTTLKC